MAPGHMHDMASACSAEICLDLRLSVSIKTFDRRPKWRVLRVRDAHSGPDPSAEGCHLK